ncbi:MAG: hypothetical protein HQL54_03245 [Magnetococcales bacterium]|nr:hypothetical protein [Magnetococcales bacterium]
MKAISNAISLVNLILDLHDPVDILWCNYDSYSSMAEDIYLGLLDVKSLTGVEDLCRRVIEQRFPPNVLAEPIHSIPLIAVDIWQFWLRERARNLSEWVKFFSENDVVVTRR